MFVVVCAPAQAQAVSGGAVAAQVTMVGTLQAAGAQYVLVPNLPDIGLTPSFRAGGAAAMGQGTALAAAYNDALFGRSEEHTSELQSLMRNSYAVFCLKKQITM